MDGDVPRDDRRAAEAAASPLVVIATFVLVAVLLTVGVYAIAFDRPEDRLQLVAAEGPEGLSFEVTDSAGGLSWSGIEAQLVDRAGTDVAATFLHLPAGKVGEGDRIEVRPGLPGGSYVLSLRAGQAELARLVVTV